MTCEQYAPWISAYQDGELAEPRRRVVEEHLACCPACRSVAAEWEALAGTLRRDLAYLNAPEGLHGRIMAAIPDAPAPAARVGGRARRGWIAFGLFPAGALMAAWLLFIGGRSAMSPSMSPVRQASSVNPSPTSPRSDPAPTRSGEGSGLSKRTEPPAPRTEPRLPKGAPNATPDTRPDLAPLRRLLRRPRAWRDWVARGDHRPPTTDHRRRSAVRRPLTVRKRAPRGVLARAGGGSFRRGQTVVSDGRVPTSLQASAVGGRSSALNTRAPSVEVMVVDYLLPEFGPAPADSAAGTEFVLRAAEPVQVTDAAFSY